MKKAVLLILVLALSGCADTRGVNKELPMRIEQGGDGNTITMNINLELESDTAGESGEARISPQTSASVYGPSQAAGTEALMDDLKYVVEKWMDNRKTDSENETTTTTPPTAGEENETDIDIQPPVVIEPGVRQALFYSKNTNGNRPTYYTGPTDLSVDLGKTVRFEVGDIFKWCVAKERPNGTVGCEWPNGLVVKNSDMYNTRGIAVLIPSEYADNHPPTGWVEIDK
jgi:hypothetical protein